MSLIVSVYVNEGIVMASDSRLTLTISNQIIGPIVAENAIPFSDSTYKTFSCPNGSGISACGNASYNNKPIAGYIEQFIDGLTKKTKVSEIPQMLIDYFNALNANVISIFQVCGYEVNDSNSVQKAYRVFTGPNARIEEQATNTTQGAMWDGETLVLSKLIKRQILSPQIIDAENVNMTNPDGTSKIIEKAAILDYKNMNLVPEAPIAWQFMSLQDAVDFVRFAIETTINTMRFQSIDKTVGGPIDILIIKPGKTKWLQHKSLK